MIYYNTGNLDPSEKHRQLVTQSVWDILLQYFPDAVTMTEDKKSCHLCLVSMCYYSTVLCRCWLYFSLYTHGLDRRTPCVTDCFNIIWVPVR